MPIPGQVFKGEIEAFDARVAQDTRTLMVRGRLPNADHKLLPGMFANVAVLAGEAEDARDRAAHRGHLRALRRQRLGGEGRHRRSRRRPQAWATVRRCRRPQAHRRAALRARRPEQGDRVAILEGVQAGEQVVTSGQLKLHPDAAVKIDNSQPLTPAAERPKQ